MKINIEAVEVGYYSKQGNIVEKFGNHETTRLSVYIDREQDNHHIEFPSNASRFEVAGLLMNLADSLTRNITE
ncbi:MAG: hypothetical protein V3U75_01460 [Methylococcaceae bacterium]